MCSVKTNVVLSGFPLTMAITYQIWEMDNGDQEQPKNRNHKKDLKRIITGAYAE